MTFNLSELNKLLGGELIGDPQTVIHGVSAIEDITHNTLIYIESETYLKQAQESAAAAVIVPLSIEKLNKPIIRVAKPQLAFAKVVSLFFPAINYKAGIHKTATVAATTNLGNNVFIGPNVVIGDNCTIGDNSVLLAGAVLGNNVKVGARCKIHPHVVIYDDSIIGNDVTLHASCVIGSDGFGYVFDGSHHQKIPHIGKVIIEDHVEIGANTVIDRASIGSTVIGYDTKIDNLVQVAHSVKLGKHNILCGMTGIAGSTKTGNHVICAANVGISDHVIIEDNVTLGARTGVAPRKRIPADTVWLGNPARPIRKAIAQMTAAQNLPELITQVKQLQQRVTKLEKEALETE